LPISLKTKDGLIVNAVFGYVNMLSKILNELKPTHLAAAFDAGRKTFRNDIYPEYKGTRKGMPEELRSQLPVLKDLLRTMGAAILEKEGYEADDVIGTLAKRFGAETCVVTGDRDLLQIIDWTTRVWLTKKGVSEVEEYDLQRLESEGLEPRNIVDLKALMGDASDNIPGVPGVGEKTALALVKRYKTIENLYAGIDEIEGKLKDRLIEGRASAELSKRLALIDTDAPVDCGEERYLFNYPLKKAAKDFLTGLNMKTALNKFVFSEEDGDETTLRNSADGANGASAYIKTETENGIKTGANIETIRVEGLSQLKKILSEYRAPYEKTRTHTRGADKEGAANGGVSDTDKTDKSGVAGNTDNTDKSGIIRGFSSDANRDGVQCGGAALVFSENVRFSFGDGKEYILNSAADLFDIKNGISLRDAADAFNECGVSLIVYDCKSVKHLLKNDGAEQLLHIGFDALLAAYLIDSNQNYPSLDAVLEYYGLPVDKKAAGLFELSRILKRKLEELGLNGLYYGIEFPLVDVLFDMENAGFRLDRAVMTELSQKYTAEINSLAAAVYRETGEKFNLNSPKQLNDVLYGKLKLPALRKNKSGGYSSSADVLSEIADLHPAIPIILKYRQFAKLQSTYIDGFKGMISSDGRIRTVFKNALTATGRLSSAEPNMQNIPVRDSEGREIRKMFVAGEGRTLVSADYSQIELRLMADFSGDENLIDAFLNNLDVHTITAAKIFNKDESEVTKEMRRAAKAVNFGIIYGISDFGLSNGLKIGRKDARAFIEKYFERYPAVKTYMDKNVEFARTHGYIKTYFGRIRFLPEIKSPNRNARMFSERAAMNMPLQGSAADIIKIAMLRVHGKLRDLRLKSKLIMTVHDELVAEAPTDEAETVKEILKSEMENAVKLKVPLTVEVGESRSWLH
jgi:DNA polymerase-1